MKKSRLIILVVVVALVLVRWCICSLWTSSTTISVNASVLVRWMLRFHRLK